MKIGNDQIVSCHRDNLKGLSMIGNDICSESTRVIAIPTDTCYGLACSFDDRLGFEEIFRLKGRSHTKPLALIVEKFEDMNTYGFITNDQISFLKTYPHPFTCLLRPKIPLPYFMDPQEYEYLGLRVGEVCIPSDIRGSLPYPLFLTSANKSGEKECFTCHEVAKIFGSKLHIFGEKSAGKPSSDVFSFVSETREIEYRRRNSLYDEKN